MRYFGNYIFSLTEAEEVYYLEILRIPFKKTFSTVVYQSLDIIWCFTGRKLFLMFDAKTH